MLRAALGSRGFPLAYSALSLAALAWLIVAAGRAPYVPLWNWAPWQLYVPLVAMLPVCLILALAIARPNPFSFGGARNANFDPARPGIVRLHRHPLLVALALWAAAHAVPNGDLAHLILFGTFAVFAIFGTRLVDHRRQREMGDTWQMLRSDVASTPLWPPSLTSEEALRLVAGLVLYATLIWLHPALIGVSPLP
jgi:uncharacterized membrane protein